MRKFDIGQLKAGCRCVTRDGNWEVATYMVRKDPHLPYPLRVELMSLSKDAKIYQTNDYTILGEDRSDQIRPLDLLMIPMMKKVYVAISNIKTGEDYYSTSQAFEKREHVIKY